MKFELIPVGKDDYGQTEYGLYITKNEILKAFDKDKGSCLENFQQSLKCLQLLVVIIVVGRLNIMYIS